MADELPPPAPSPTPKIDPPRHDTREEMKAVSAEQKASKKRRPLKYGAVVTALLAALSAGGYGAKKSTSTANATGQLASATGQLSVRIDERQKALKETVDRHEVEIESQRRAEDKLQRHFDVFRAEQRATNRALLDALKVPKSKWPTIEPDEEEP